jgi:hypothetical protein
VIEEHRRSSREEKGFPLTLEDLKLMSDIPSTMWDPLIQYNTIYFIPIKVPQGAITNMHS